MLKVYSFYFGSHLKLLMKRDCSQLPEEAPITPFRKQSETARCAAEICSRQHMQNAFSEYLLA